ncbi:MAG: mechanosensitive ion channel [Bacteroidales bacterium]|nr:mechanosensitive ion channel [Bacteroidales bacterium]
MKKIKATFSQIIFVLLCSLLMITTKVNAQGNITTSILEPIWEVPDTIIPIDATDIISSAETSSTILSEVSKSLPDSALMADYSNRLAEVIGIIDTIYIELEGYDQEDVGYRLHQNYKNQLTLLQSSIKSLKNDLDKKSKELSGQWDKTDFIARNWTLTLETGEPEPLSESLRTRSESILAEVLEEREIINTLGNELLAMADQLLTASQELEKLITQMLATEEMVRRNHLRKTHPAIWESDTLRGEAISPVKVYQSTVTAYKDGLNGFYSVYKYWVYLHLGILLFLLTVSFIIRRKLNKWTLDTDDERIAKFLKIFKRPVAVSFTLAIFLSFLLYPNAPGVFRDMSSILIIIPLLVVAMQVLPKKTHIYLFSITALFIFEKLVETVKYGNYPLPGFLLLLVLVATTAYVIWFIIRRGRKYKNAAKRNIRWMDISLWLALIILLAALVAHILGYVAFGFYLFKGVIISIMAGLLISVSVNIIDGFFTLIIMGKSSQVHGLVYEYGDKLVNRIIRVVKLVAVIYWLGIVLKRFLIYNEVIGWLEDIFQSQWKVNETTFSLKGIILFGLIIFLAIWLARFIRLLMEKELFPRIKFGRGVPGIISLIVRYTIITIGFILSLSVLGVDMTKLTILIGALGVGIGFGLQDLINNLISGFILIFERPIQVGDTVQFGEREGKVKEIGIRSSIIKTYDGSEVIVPNGKLISEELINLTLSDPILRVEINVGTEYGSDPQEIIDILVMQAKLHPDVIPNPETFAIFFGYGDFALNFRLYAYTLEVNSRLRIRSELNLAIFQAFKEANIKIPFPIQDLNVNILDKKETEK